MHFVYVLYSPKNDKYYIGETVSLQGRLQQHKNHHYQGSSTSYSADWEIALSFKVKTRHEAIVIEKHLKKMKSKTYLHKLREDLVSSVKFKSIILEKYGIVIN